jgi:ABC-type polysaccharide/polyol phosphate export permease
MQGLFFLTPILYKHDALAGKVAWLVGMNPVTPFIALFRAPLIEAALPSGSILLQTVAISSSAMAIGLFVFLRQEKKIVFRL